MNETKPSTEVAEERPGLMICCMRSADRFGSQHPRTPIPKGATLTCDKCSQEIESLGGQAWKVKQ